MNSKHFYFKKQEPIRVPKKSRYAIIFHSCTSAQSKRIKQLLSSKPEPKKKETNTDYNLIFDLGTILEHKYSGNQMLYLYSQDEIHYGIWENIIFEDDVKCVGFYKKEFQLSNVDLDLALYAVSRFCTTKREDCAIYFSLKKQIESMNSNTKDNCDT